MLDANFWHNKSTAQKVVKEKKIHEDLINSHSSSVKELKELNDLYELAVDENNQSIMNETLENIKGIIILGGATNPYLSEIYNQITVNESAERLIESSYLIKKYPNAKIYFAGGSGSLNFPKLSHAVVAKKFYENFNIDTDKIIFDYTSRNTYENILFAKQKFNPKKSENWIIITSAFHLTRSINIAEKLNWRLIPYPTDYRLPKKFEWKRGDFVYIPPYVAHKHFNSDPNNQARIISIHNRVLKAMGAAWYEQLEPYEGYVEGEDPIELLKKYGLRDV